MLEDILNDLEGKIKELNIFNTIGRGILAVEDLKYKDYPVIRYNIDKIEVNDVLTTFDRTVFTAYVNYLIYLKVNKSDDYFSEIDKYRSSILKFFSCILPDFNDSCLGVNLEVAKEEVNDGYIDGLYILRVVISIDYIIK